MKQEELIQIYSNAQYQIPSIPTHLRVGDNNPEFDTFLSLKNAKSAALITAMNPYSQQLAQEENIHRNEGLKKDILNKWKFTDAIASDSKSEEWEEIGFIIFDIKLVDALSLAGTYGQHAILYIEKSKAVELIFTGAEIKSNDDWRKKLMGL